MFRVHFVSETAQVELRSGRVPAPAWPARVKIARNMLLEIPGRSCSCAPPPPPNMRCVLPVPD